MAEVLGVVSGAVGIISSVTAVLDFTGKAIKVVNSFRRYREEKENLIKSLESLQEFLEGFRHRLQNASPTDSTSDGIKALARKSGTFNDKMRYEAPPGTSHGEGPLAQLFKAMADLAAKLELTNSNSLRDRSKVHDMKRRITWHFDKSTIEVLMNEIARSQINIGLVLNNDHAEMSRVRFDRVEEKLDMAQKDEELRRIERRQKYAQKERADIKRHLSPLEEQGKYRELLDRYQRIGEWFFDTPQFKAWTAGRISQLRCFGAPGAGKVCHCSRSCLQVPVDEAAHIW